MASSLRLFLSVPLLRCRRDGGRTSLLGVNLADRVGEGCAAFMIERAMARTATKRPQAPTDRTIAGSSSRSPRDRRSGQERLAAVAINRRARMADKASLGHVAPFAATDDKTSSERKKMDIVTMRQYGPHTPGEKQHDADGERAQNHQVPRAERRQLILK